MTREYQITGMTCGKCVAKVKSELLRIGDIESAEIRLQHPQATLNMQGRIGLDSLQKAVQKAGDYRILELASENPKMSVAAEQKKSSSYFPLLLIFSYITAITVLVQVVKGSFSWMQLMSHFMAGFFFVFSFFKLIDLRGFAEGYRRYDLIAGSYPGWGYVYPFVELSLAICFLTGVVPLGTNIATFLVMSIGTLGVWQGLAGKTKLQCACLGAIINLPLSKITLFEYLLMLIMSGIMIIHLV